MIGLVKWIRDTLKRHGDERERIERMEQYFALKLQQQEKWSSRKVR